MTIAQFERSALGPLKRISQGGHGRVYLVPELQLATELNLTSEREIVRAAFKEYLYPEQLDVAELQRRVSFFESLDPSSRSRILSISAWPLRLVSFEGRISGFIMAELPDRYRMLINLPSGPKLRAAEVQYILNTPHYLKNAHIGVTDRLRAEILHDVVGALQFFHNNEIIVGDLSPKNLLFSPSQSPRAFYLDCDGMRFRGGDVHPQLETPGWTLPDPSEPRATPSADIYKLALLVIRLYSGSQALRTIDGARIPTGLVEVVRSSLVADPRLRPAISDWLDPIADTLEATRVEALPNSRLDSSGVPLWRTVALEPTRDSPEVQDASVKRLPRFSLGEPIILPLSGKRLEEDPDLAEYARQSADKWKFMLVKLSCSFYPNEEEPLLQAEVSATLRNDDPDGIQPIAWSVDPRFIIDSVDRSSAAKAGTEISLLGGTSYQNTSNFSAKEYFLQALGQHEADVLWIFRRTKSSRLTGTYTLTIVVRLPPNGHCLMEFTILAYVQRRRLGVVPYRALIPRKVRSLELDIPRRVRGERYPGD